MTPITQVSYLHVAGDRSDPFEAFESVILGCPYSLDEALLVLPEMFNVRNVNFPREPIDLIATFADAVEIFRRACAKRHCSLVVSLIEEETNRAVLIDPSGELSMLSEKVCKDSSCFGSYPRYRPGSPDSDRVVFHRGVMIGSSVCMDASSSGGDDRHEAIRRKFRESSSPRILSIPSYMTSVDPRLVCDKWKGECTAVVANRSGIDSAISGDPTLSSVAGLTSDYLRSPKALSAWLPDRR